MYKPWWLPSLRITQYIQCMTESKRYFWTAFLFFSCVWKPPFFSRLSLPICCQRKPQGGRWGGGDLQCLSKRRKIILLDYNLSFTFYKLFVVFMWEVTPLWNVLLQWKDESLIIYCSLVLGYQQLVPYFIVHFWRVIFAKMLAQVECQAGFAQPLQGCAVAISQPGA